MTVMSAREFNHAVAIAQRSAVHEPVVITRRGEPAFVLLSFAEYTRLRTLEDDRPLSRRLAPESGEDLDDVDFPRDPGHGRSVPGF